MCHSLAQLAENIYFQKLPMTGFELQTLMLVVVEDAESGFFMCHSLAQLAENILFPEIAYDWI